MVSGDHSCWLSRQVAAVGKLIILFFSEISPNELLLEQRQQSMVVGHVDLSLGCQKTVNLKLGCWQWLLGLELGWSELGRNLKWGIGGRKLEGCQWADFFSVSSPLIRLPKLRTMILWGKSPPHHSARLVVNHWGKHRVRSCWCGQLSQLVEQPYLEVKLNSHSEQWMELTFKSITN